MELQLEHLTKQYGSLIAVDNLNTTLTCGIYGLLGANGSGKTTLMRLICDIQSPTAGSICYDGLDIQTAGERYRDRKSVV